MLVVGLPSEGRRVGQTESGAEDRVTFNSTCAYVFTCDAQHSSVTERQTDRQTDRDRERQGETGRDRNRQTDRDRQTETETDRQSQRQRV